LRQKQNIAHFTPNLSIPQPTILAARFWKPKLIFFRIEGFLYLFWRKAPQRDNEKYNYSADHLVGRRDFVVETLFDLASYRHSRK